MVRKGRPKKKPKKGKVLILVEGESDKIFVEGLLKELGIKSFFDVKSFSKRSGGTDILNKRKVKGKIEDAIDDGYSKTLIILDLKTQRSGTNTYFNCYPELKKFYLEHILSDQFSDYVKIIVALRELECWELLAEEKCNTATINDCTKKLVKHLGWRQTPDKVELAQYYVKKLRLIIENQAFNESFKYFLSCLKEFLPKEQQDLLESLH